MTRARTLHVSVLGMAAALALLPVSVAEAAPDGSVPAEVREYVTDGSLVERLADVYGPDASGKGVDFDDTTKTGTIVRVYAWTAAQLAGEDTDHPVELRNEWIVPVTIADQPVGLATIWINPQTVLPELAEFDADPQLATALSAVPDGASLVRDDASRAWLALADDGIVTPLVPGSTGLSTPVPLDQVALAQPPGGTPVVAPEPNTGLGFAIGVIAVLVIVVVAALVLPGLRRRSTGAPTESAPEKTPEPIEP